MGSFLAKVPDVLFGSLIGGLVVIGLGIMLATYYRIQYRALVDLAHLRMNTGFHEEDERHRSFALRMLFLGLLQSFFITLGCLIAGAIATPITGLALLVWFFGWPFRRWRREARFELDPGMAGTGFGAGCLAWVLAAGVGVVWGVAVWLESGG